MSLIARRGVAGALLGLLLTSSATAQLTDAIPRATYFATKEVFYSGEYRDAERNLRRERGVRVGQTNWIDAICYHSMLGEILYHEGRNREALAEFDQACQVFLAYPNWLLQVKFQSTTGGGLRADLNRTRRVAPWGQSSRTFVLGQFADTEQVLVGDLNAQQTLQTGGVYSAPQYWRVNVVEVMRGTALAIRRRNDLLGPLAPQDAISKNLSSALASNKLAPPNHWSNAWIDVLRGLAQIGMGKLDEADMLLGRSLVVEGQFDHPLTCVALLEQGRIAMAKGDQKRAAQMLAEAGFSAFYADDWGVLTESALNGWINHLASNAAGVYPPLDSIAAWAQINRLQHLAIKARLAQAESLLWLGQVTAGAAIVEDTGRRMAEMRGGLPAVHQLFLQAVVQLLQGKSEPGGELLTRAMTLQAGVSLRNFQILLSNQLFDSRAASARVAVDFYKTLLADPLPSDWTRDPLDVMAVMKTTQDAAFDRWFMAALERKEPSLAFEIAERSKRRRYLATLPFGGRLLALRAILESPVASLSQEAILQRQQILGKFPEYQTLTDAGIKTRDQLVASPILPSGPAETKVLGQLYDAWHESAIKRQQMLTQFAPRRMASAFEFPPLRTTAELQQSLGAGEALVAFHNVGGNLFGFVLTGKDARMWQLPDARRLRAGLADSLKAIGNYSANRQLTVAEFESQTWRESAKAAYTTIFGEAKTDLTKATSLIVVPDDVLWYLPFEVLIPPGPNPAAGDEKTFADRFPIRYGPTGALAVPLPNPLRRTQHTAILANDLKFGGDENDQAALLQELASSFTGPLVLSDALPAAANLISPLIDQLIVMDDIADTAAIGEATSLLPRSRGTTKGWLNHWIMMPIGGPEQIVLTGVATEAEQGLKTPKRPSSRSSAVRQEAAGGEIFQSLCNMMAGGARTVLMTRWRTSGRTNFDLVREFAKELPSAPASDAWQRATLLAREAPLDISREPRFKRSDDAGDLPTADHPFFWAGYILVDTGPRPEPPPTTDPLKPGQPIPAEGAKDKEQTPPSAKPGEPETKNPAAEGAKPGAEGETKMPAAEPSEPASKEKPGNFTNPSDAAEK